LEQNKFLKRMQSTRRYWKEHPEEITEDNKEMLKEKRDIQNQYQMLMEQWCRLTLDVLIYMGVTIVRKEKLAHMVVENVQEKNQTVDAHNKWLDVIAGLYKSIQFERKLFKEYAAKMNLKLNEEIEERLLKQQNLIKSSWMTSLK
jgi:hypothetical protein